MNMYRLSRKRKRAALAVAGWSSSVCQWGPHLCYSTALLLKHSATLLL